MRNWASAGVSRRNMARKAFDADAGERYRPEGRKTLFYLDVGGLYDGGPLRQLACEQLAELGRRADLDLSAQRRQSRACLRLGKAVAERGVELVDDGGRRSGWSYHAQPERRLQLGIARLRRRRHVGQFREAFGAGRRVPDWMWGRLLVAGSAMI